MVVDRVETVSIRVWIAAVPKIVRVEIHLGRIRNRGTIVDVVGDAITWTTDLPPSGDSALVFRTRADACIPPTLRETQLNFGGDIAAYNACDVLVGDTASSLPIPFETLVDVTMSALDLPFPPEIITMPAGDMSVQLVHAGATVAYQLSLSLG